MTKIYQDTITIDAALLQGTNPLPQFRDPCHNKTVQFTTPVSDAEKKLAGSETGFRMLPYKKQDRYKRTRKRQQIQTIVAEGNTLKAVFLPEWGGRLWSLYDKHAGKNLLFTNDVLQPANLAIRDAWFSGGIEWNFGQYGHAFTTCSPVNFAEVATAEGEIFLRMYQYERCKNFVWQIDFHFPEDEPVLGAHMSVYNLNDEELPMYYWTNIAVPQTTDSRVFASGSSILFIDPTAPQNEYRFGKGQMPEIAAAPGIDASYPDRLGYSNEYFFDCSRSSHPWEAVVTKDGSGIFDISTNMLKYRKMFCWGSLEGGKHWSSFLAGKGETTILKKSSSLDKSAGKYFEIQAGLAPTQLHGITMPPKATWHWTQFFGYVQTNAKEVHENAARWKNGQKHIADSIHEIIPDSYIKQAESTYNKMASLNPWRILFYAQHWGALENKRRKACNERPMPSVCPFKLTYEAEQYPEYNEIKPWLALLDTGIYPPQQPEEVPISFMTQTCWKQILEKSLACSSKENHWLILYHLGVIAFEHHDTESAQYYWTKSNESTENAWAYRNLAIAALQQGSTDSSKEAYTRALASPGGKTDSAIAEEYVRLLVQEKQYDKALEVYNTLPEQWRLNDILLIEYGKIMAAKGNKQEVLNVLAHNFSNIREKEYPLTDLWFSIEEKQPPFSIDFRMA